MTSTTTMPTAIAEEQTAAAPPISPAELQARVKAQKEAAFAQRRSQALAADSAPDSPPLTAAPRTPIQPTQPARLMQQTQQQQMAQLYGGQPQLASGPAPTLIQAEQRAYLAGLEKAREEMPQTLEFQAAQMNALVTGAGLTLATIAGLFGAYKLVRWALGSGTTAAAVPK